MNLNSELLALSTILNCPVKQDVYKGKENRFVVFTYENEEPELCGDNDVLIEKGSIQLSYYVPESYNYFNDKATIKSYLRGLDYYIESVQTFMDDEDIKDSVQLRRLLFFIQKAV
jgi:hypothetical protein